MNTMMKKIVGCVGLIMSLTWASQAATKTWTGTGDASGNWSVAGNWAPSGVLVAGDSLVFGPAGTGGTTTLTNDTTLTSWGSITFTNDAPPYTIVGNAFATNNLTGLTNNSASAQIINNTFYNVMGSLNVYCIGDLTLGGGFNRYPNYSPSINMNGTGKLIFNDNTGVSSGGVGYGGINVWSGTVVLAKTGTGLFGINVNVLNGGKLQMGNSVNQMGSQYPVSIAPGGTIDLNGYDSALAGNLGLIGPLGGTVVNDAAGNGANILTIRGWASASFGGTIKDGATAKIALSLGDATANNILFQLFSGTNTYSGGTTFNETGSGTGSATLSISRMENIGALGSRNLTFNGTSASYLQINGTAITNLSGFNSVTFNTGKRGGFDIADPSNTVTLSQAVNSGASGIFAKNGAGTLVLTGAATYTGATYVNGGPLTVDYQAGGSLNSATAPAFSGGNLYLLGKTSGATSQTLGNLTVNAGGGNLLIDPNNGTSTTLACGTLTTTAAGGSFVLGKALNAGSGTVTNTTTTNKKADNTYGGRVIFANGTANTGYDFATTYSGGSPYTLAAYTNATLLPTTVGASATNYKMTNNTVLAGNVAANSLKLESPAGDLALGANLLTITSGGLLSTGTSAVNITGDAGVTGLTAGNGSGSYDLIVHQYNSNGLTINAVIGNNGANAVSLVKAGPGTLTLSGTNTYTGATYINGGALSITSDRNLVGANGTFSNLTSSLSSPTVTSTAASIPDGFGTGVGAQMLGRRIMSISGTPGNYTITLSSNALTALNNGTASWVYLPSGGLTLYINNGGRLQTSGNFALEEFNSDGAGTVPTYDRAINIGSGGGGIEVLSGTLTNAGVITANGQFIKSGPGMLVSTVANTFNTGGLTVNDGTMLFTAANTFNNRVTVNGGTLRFSLTGNNFYGGVTLNGGTLQFTAANTIPGGVTLNGGATLSLSSLSYMGSTALAFAGGTLQLTGAQSLPNSLNINWATFSGGFDITNAATTFMVTNAISGAGSLVKSGSGTLVLTGSNTYSGATIISNGTLACYTNTLITPAVVTYLDQYTGRVAANLTNGVGMTPNNPVTSTSTCGYNSSDMWLSQQYSTNTWVTFDLGSEKSLSGFHLWNYNEPAALNRGVRVARIYTNSVGLASGSSYASAGPGWTGGGLVTTMNFAKAGGTSTEPGSDYMFNTMVSTRFIQIYVTTNWGDSAYTGLSEIRFYAGSPVAAIPTNTALTIASSGILDLFNGGLTVKDLTGAGTIANLGGTLTVTGTNTFTGNILGTGALNVSGVISPAGRNVFGTNTVTQALTFSGTLEVDVATDGTSDQLVTQGALNLTGATVSVVNELGLSLGKRYVILKYDTVTGDFSDILLPRLWMTKKDTVNKQILLLAKTGTMVRFF